MRMRGWWHIELGACRACIIRPTASKRARVRSLAFVINITQQLPTPTRPNAPTYAHQLSFLSAFHVAFRNFLASVARQKRRRETPPSTLPPLDTLQQVQSAYALRHVAYFAYSALRITLYYWRVHPPCPQPPTLPLLSPPLPRQCLVSVSPASRCRWLRRIKILKCVRNCYTLRIGYIDFGQQFATHLGRYLRTPNVLYVNILYQHQQGTRSTHLCLSVCPLVRMSICPFVATPTRLSVVGLSCWNTAVMLPITARCI